MRIKRLEVAGFKSFKDKTVLHFDHGITGIVGPNGCGKSNIVDAFFWVMGEQSHKHMRASGSKDLIFNGSSKYQPLGLAEATLVMEAIDIDNAPAGASADPQKAIKTKEISVTRRVYRTGEGEYFVNGVPARLKDIKELFMDTGVGAKGYSVIEQGQIDKVVNSKPEERRLLIEEAAGIAKYKTRKTESLRKMEATRGNLERLNDVIQEIERSLSSLERQAQKAKKYREYKEELFEKEITWGRRKTRVIRQRLSDDKEEKQHLETELVSQKAKLSEVENQIEIDRTAQLTESKISEELQVTIQEVSSKLAQAKSALDLSRHRQEDLEARLESLTFEKIELEGSIREERYDVEQKTNELEQNESRLASLEVDVKALEETVQQLRREAEASRTGLNQAQKELMDGISRSSELTSKSASLKAKKESADQSLEKIATRFNEIKERSDRSNEEIQTLGETIRQAKETSENAASRTKEIDIEVSTLRESVKSFRSEKNEASSDLTKIESRLQSLVELDQAREGFGEGPKKILDWAKTNHKDDRFKVVADHFKVTAGFESALEGWLESRLEDLATNDIEDALSALRQLKEQKSGRATIHLRQSHASHAASDAATVIDSLKFSEVNVIGELKSFVEVEESFSHIVDRVIVVESSDDFVKFLRTKSLLDLKGFSLVSQDGVALQSDGAIRGGVIESDSSASILGRKRAIEELDLSLNAAKEKLNSVANRLEETEKELASRELDLETSKNELKNAEIRLAGLERDYIQAKRSHDDLENSLEKLAREKDQAEAEKLKIDEDQALIKDELEAFESKKSELERLVEEQGQSLSSQDESLRDQEVKFQEQKIDEASTKERVASIKREIESARSVVSGKEARISEVTGLIQRVSEERDQHTGGDSGIEEEIAGLTKELSEKQTHLSEVKDRLETISRMINENMDFVKSAHSEIDQKSKRANDLAVELEKLSAEYSHMIQNLEEKYGPGCLERTESVHEQEDMGKDVVTQEMSEEEEQALEEQVEKLRDRIRRLGEVNTMAIDEYDETKLRYDYLIKEKLDLEGSLENLQSAIDHINETSEQRFKIAFDAIKERFEKLFPIIFGGGRAELSLVFKEDAQDILDCGVDILAQPPGKKIVNIGLLSGGEKALTAISLIFAIFMVKPSPFCLLDEVDAPLDDSNIGKFNALLREMAVKTQFIVITHNKKTMELNDTLYGVTMEEPGVSKMVSIELH